MTTAVPVPQTTEVFYPSSDGEPLAETSVHIDAIIDTVVALRQFVGERGIVLTNQFLYYAQGYPRLRVTPDVMIIFNVPPGPRDNYKIWQEGQIPCVIFEMTSEGTRERDQTFKWVLYEQLEVQEYWQFDPKGEWIEGKLRGYRMRREAYELITDRRSEPLNLRLEVDGQLIAFYREDTGERLQAPIHLMENLRTEILARQEAEVCAEQERQRAEQEHQRAEQERQRAEQERQRAEQAEQEVEQLREHLRSLGVNPDTIA